MNGQYAEIHSANRRVGTEYDERLFSFVRWHGNERLIVISNFSADRHYALDLRLPPAIVAAWNLADGDYRLDEKLYGTTRATLRVADGSASASVRLGPLESLVYKLDAPISHAVPSVAP